MITNKIELFFINIGLIHAGANYHNPADAPICGLVESIRALDLPAATKNWFCLARTGQVAVNPFYPRGSDLAAACFFLRDGRLNETAYYAFLKACGSQDPIGEGDFREWMSRFAEILSGMFALPSAMALWHEYESIIADRSDAWCSMIASAQNKIHACYGDAAPELLFCPNLFNQYLADYVRLDNQIIVIAIEPNGESMLHEALHPLFAAYRDRFLAYADKQPIAPFADEAAMLETGYMADASAAAKAHVLEECFVRALSVVLSGGGSERVDFHQRCGFRGVAHLAERFRDAAINREGILAVVEASLR
ncbi:MAG: hypothetical protein LBN04_06435 [Oscillospiraceae bacterium]|jgi:hypothetical protein|nr:hypothetical protein [Oscillospiraceae bacterium]